LLVRRHTVARQGSHAHQCQLLGDDIAGYICDLEITARVFPPRQGDLNDSIAGNYSGFTQLAGSIGAVQNTPPSLMVWLPPSSVARISNS